MHKTISMNGIVAFIPARGGSKRIPDKNVKLFCGKPLLIWAVDAACKSAYINEVIVSTDSHDIAAMVKRYDPPMVTKITTSFDEIVPTVIMRSSETANDEATTESAMLEYFEQVEHETVILLQATSPLITSKDIDRAMSKFLECDYDSLLSVVRQKRFVWTESRPVGGLIANPQNYEIENRPRSQDFKGQLVENGAIYITKYDKLMETKNRLSGRIGLYEMPEYTYLEVDNLEDFAALEAIMRYRQTKWAIE